MSEQWLLAGAGSSSSSSRKVLGLTSTAVFVLATPKNPIDQGDRLPCRNGSAEGPVNSVKLSARLAPWDNVTACCCQPLCKSNVHSHKLLARAQTSTMFVA
jgi:hypothetical protein